jgi:hypothetical protein
VKPSLEVVERQLREFERNGMWDLLDLKGNPRALILKYEAFVNDWDHLFFNLEEFFEVRISERKKKECLSKYSINEVEKRARSLGSFSTYEKESQIHGRHISQFRGRVGYGVEFLSAEMIEMIYDRFRLIFEAFSYDDPRQ